MSHENRLLSNAGPYFHEICWFTKLEYVPSVDLIEWTQIIIPATIPVSSDGLESWGRRRI